MRALPLLLLIAACFEDEPPRGCPDIPCPAGHFCNLAGACEALRLDAGAADAGVAPDAGPSCGNGVVEAGEACDDANIIETDGCLSGCVVAVCGDGILRRRSEDCDQGQDNGGDHCTANCRRPGVFDGRDEAAAALSCRHLRRDHPELPSSGYWIDFDGVGGEPAVQLFCELGLDGGGWTHMAHLNRGDQLWDAWAVAQARPGSVAAWGLPIQLLVQDDPRGEDLEYFLAVRGTFAGSLVHSPYYTGLRAGAWNPQPVFEVFDPDGFIFRSPGIDAEVCDEPLWHRTEAWNWAAARGEFGCAGWSAGDGFIIHGSEEAPETAETIWGMRLFGAGNRGAQFDAIDLYVR
jgi:cysteine-rich repeat protein